MTQEELRRLEMNLTKSDSKAKQGYVRCKVGLLPEDQGFAPLDALPVFNHIQNRETKLAEFIEDAKILNDKHMKLTISHVSLENEYAIFKKESIARDAQLQAQIDKIVAVETQELRVVIASLADRLKKLEDETDII
jgi:hypothetical protein